MTDPTAGSGAGSQAARLEVVPRRCGLEPALQTGHGHWYVRDPRMLPPPTTSNRRTVSFAITALVATIVWAGTAVREPMDFDYLFLAAGAVARGQDPYVAVERAVEAGALERPLFYPATAAVILAPLGRFSERVALSVFLALAFGALSYGVTRTGWWRLGLIASAPAVHSVLFGQWAPWLVAGVMLPGLSILWAAKPSLGLALYVGWPSRWALIGGLALTLLATLIVGHQWPGEWLSALQAGRGNYVAPVARPWGWLLLAAWLAWRRPEGRMLGALALIPHTTSLSDALYPLLIARTGRELAWLVALGYGASTLLAVHTYARFEPSQMLAEQWPIMLVLVYLPSLGLLLRQAWGDRRKGRVPALT